MPHDYGFNPNCQPKVNRLPDFHATVLPKPVGYWSVGGVMNFTVYRKPSRWKRFWAQYFLGWTWMDSSDPAIDAR